MWDNVTFSVRHCSDLPFIRLPLYFFCFSLFPISCFKCISLLYSSRSLSFIVHILTSRLFQCLIEALLASSSIPFFPDTFPPLLPLYLSFNSLLVHVFPPVFPLSSSPQFILLFLLASWLQQCTSKPLSAWSGCLRQCGVNGVSVSYRGSVIEWAHCTQKGSNPMP